jgi:signal transduction histidine kinase
VDFLAEASHELLTPLTSIKSYAELLSTGDCDTEEMRKELYNTINTETDRLTDLVRNLLNVSKLETGHLDMQRALVKTDWLVDQCLPAVQAAAADKDITIEKRLPDVFPTIMGDKELLKVVLVNILGNAVKYTPEGGTVRLALFQQDHDVFVEVSDTGCGIASEDLPRVFEKFYRGSGSSVRDQVGSGLGLATALQIAKLHGGTIDVQSEPGKGSCFTVKVPEEDYSLEKR